MYKLLLQITLSVLLFSDIFSCDSNSFTLDEDYFNESIVGYYLGALDMNTGSTNISLFRYSVSSTDNNCYQNSISLKLKFSFKIFSPSLGFTSTEELVSGEIKLSNISSHIIISNNDIDFSTTSVPGATFTLLDYNGPTDFNSSEMTSIISSILQSGKVPNGTYSFNFSLLTSDGVIIDQLNKNIEIYEPSYISLISPGGSINDLDNNIIYSTQPSFFWQMDQCSNCSLGIRLSEFNPIFHNSLSDAISSTSNLPISSYDDFYPINDITNSFQYPVLGGQSLYPGKIYVWQLKRTYNTTIGIENLYSPIYIFKVADVTSNQIKDPNIDQIRLIIGDVKFETIFGIEGSLKGYDYNLKSINNKNSNININDLYKISSKFNDGKYKVIEVIIE